MKGEIFMYKTTVKIEGMMCPMCEAHVNDALKKEFPEVQSVKSSHKKNETVIISEKEYTEDSLRAVIDHAGYKVISAESVPYEKKFSLFGK